MSEVHILRAAARVGATENNILVETTAANTAEFIDLYTVFPTADDGETFLDIYSDQLLYYKFASSTATPVDQTATSGAARCFASPADATFRRLVPRGCRYLGVKTTVIAGIRICKSSEVRS
jgi:hypothetical protein